MSPEHSQHPRDRLGQLHFISDERISEILSSFDQNDAALMEPYLDQELVVEELRELMFEVIDWSTRDLLPIVLSVQYIAALTANGLRNQSRVAWQNDELENAIIADDLAEGVNNITSSITGATISRNSQDIGDAISHAMEIIRSNHPDIDTLDVTLEFTQESITQKRLLRDDPTGNLLLDRLVRMIEEMRQDPRAINISPKRIGAFVIKGAHTARDIYKKVYPLAKRVVEDYTDQASTT